MRVDKIIESIEDAIEKRCFLPALALSLVLPDICAQYDYPKIYDKKAEYNGCKGEGAAYAKWYDENIGNYDIIPRTGIAPLDGKNCWKLRCQFLHSGSIDLDHFMSGDDRHIEFSLVAMETSALNCGIIGGCSSIEYDKDMKNLRIELDVVNFCGKILEVIKYSYLMDQNFIAQTDGQALNYIEYE